MFGRFSSKLGENIEGPVPPNTEITDRPPRRRWQRHETALPPGPLKEALGPLEPGKEYDFKIIKISPENRAKNRAQLQKRAVKTSRAPGKIRANNPLDDKNFFHRKPSATC